MLEALSNESGIRLGISLGIFLFMAIWETVRPRRILSESKLRRWVVNLGIIIFNIVFVRFTVGAFAFTVAIFTQTKGWGLFNYFELIPWIVIVTSVIVLDFAIYLQHIIVHAVPLFWRFHRVHHTDLDLDVSSGMRFHPVEILFSLLYKSMIVILMGAPPIAVLIFEVILNAASLFNHGNIYIPKSIDRLLRYIIVTPDMHRIHHSTVVDETNSNFGFSVSCWDRMCGTYTQSPSLGQLEMNIGLKEYRNQYELGIFKLIALPFRGRMGQYSYRKEQNFKK